MWKSEKLLRKEAEIEQLLSSLKPIDQFEKEINHAMNNLDIANGFIGEYIQQRTTALGI